MTITGRYLYTDENVPAQIDIDGKPCKVVSFDQTNQLSAQIVCETSSVDAPPAHTDFIGNKGITLISEAFYTAHADLETATITGSASYSTLTDEVLYNDPVVGDKTVWLKGFFYPRVTGSYLFQHQTNSGNSKFFMSLGGSEDSANTTLIATHSQQWNTVYLEADTK